MKEKEFTKILILFLFCNIVFVLPFCNLSWARDTFRLSLQVEDTFGYSGFKKIEDFVLSLNNNAMSNLIKSYTENSEVTASLDFRGLEALAFYDINSPYLTFTVPSLNINVLFKGESRDDSAEMLWKWLKGEGKHLLTLLLKGMAKASPIDPVAGNPTSLMASMAAHDFEAGIDSGMDGLESAIDKKIPNQMWIGARFGRYTGKDYNTDVYTLPISYTIKNNINVNASLETVDNEDSKAYKFSLGLGFRLRLSKIVKEGEEVIRRKARIWSITPAARVGIVGSRDLGAAALIYSGSITSSYDIYFNDLKFSIGNMFGIYETGAIEIFGFDLDYDLTNYILRNGIGLEGLLDFTVFGHLTSWEISVVDTNFFGDDLYIEHYDDIAFSIGTRHIPGSPSWKSIRIGFTVTIGEKGYLGSRINFGYKF